MELLSIDLKLDIYKASPFLTNFQLVTNLLWGRVLVSLLSVFIIISMCIIKKSKSKSKNSRKSELIFVQRIYLLILSSLSILCLEQTLLEPLRSLYTLLIPQK